MNADELVLVFSLVAPIVLVTPMVLKMWWDEREHKKYMQRRAK